MGLGATDTGSTGVSDIRVKAASYCGLPYDELTPHEPNWARITSLGSGGFGEAELMEYTGKTTDMYERRVLKKSKRIAKKGLHSHINAATMWADHEFLANDLICSRESPCPPFSPHASLLGIEVDPNTQIRKTYVEVAADPIVSGAGVGVSPQSLESFFTLDTDGEQVWRRYASSVSFIPVDDSKPSSDPTSLGAVRDLDAALVAGIQILEGLRHYRSRGLVQRDLKPENTIIDANNGLMRLIDLGGVQASAELVDPVKRAALLPPSMRGLELKCPQTTYGAEASSKDGLSSQQSPNYPLAMVCSYTYGAVTPVFMSPRVAFSAALEDDHALLEALAAAPGYGPAIYGAAGYQALAQAFQHYPPARPVGRDKKLEFMSSKPPRADRCPSADVLATDDLFPLGLTMLQLLTGSFNDVRDLIDAGCQEDDGIWSNTWNGIPVELDRRCVAAAVVDGYAVKSLRAALAKFVALDNVVKPPTTDAEKTLAKQRLWTLMHAISSVGPAAKRAGKEGAYEALVQQHKYKLPPDYEFDHLQGLMNGLAALKGTGPAKNNAGNGNSNSVGNPQPLLNVLGSAKPAIDRLASNAAAELQAERQLYMFVAGNGNSDPNGISGSLNSYSASGDGGGKNNGFQGYLAAMAKAAEHKKQFQHSFREVSEDSGLLNSQESQQQKQASRALRHDRRLDTANASVAGPTVASTTAAAVAANAAPARKKRAGPYDFLRQTLIPTDPEKAALIYQQEALSPDHAAKRARMMDDAMALVKARRAAMGLKEKVKEQKNPAAPGAAVPAVGAPQAPAGAGASVSSTSVASIPRFAEIEVDADAIAAMDASASMVLAHGPPLAVLAPASQPILPAKPAVIVSPSFATSSAAMSRLLASDPFLKVADKYLYQDLAKGAAHGPYASIRYYPTPLLQLVTLRLDEHIEDTAEVLDDGLDPSTFQNALIPLPTKAQAPTLHLILEALLALLNLNAAGQKQPEEIQFLFEQARQSLYEEGIAAGKLHSPTSGAALSLPRSALESLRSHTSCEATCHNTVGAMGAAVTKALNRRGAAAAAVQAMARDDILKACKGASGAKTSFKGLKHNATVCPAISARLSNYALDGVAFPTLVTRPNALTPATMDGVCREVCLSFATDLLRTSTGPRRHFMSQKQEKEVVKKALAWRAGGDNAQPFTWASTVTLKGPSKQKGGLKGVLLSTKFDGKVREIRVVETKAPAGAVAGASTLSVAWKAVGAANDKGSQPISMDAAHRKVTTCEEAKRSLAPAAAAGTGPFFDLCGSRKTGPLGTCVCLMLEAAPNRPAARHEVDALRIWFDDADEAERFMALTSKAIEGLSNPAPVRA